MKNDLPKLMALALCTVVLAGTGLDGKQHAQGPRSGFLFA